MGLATLTSCAINFLMITAICSVINELKESFFWFTRDSLRKGLIDYLKIGIPNAAMLCLEWGGLEILALLASLISVDATGA